MRVLANAVAAALALLLLAASGASATSLQPVGNAGSFEEPTYVTSDPGNANRLFVVERAGRIKQVSNGVVSVYADIRAAVGCGSECSGERGLLSIAFAPDFDSSGRLYVDYANDGDGELHVAELVDTGGTIGPLRDLLSIPHGENSNHNGGQLQFGPDGHLYISTGDGGGSNDVHHNAQNRASLLGKILRIDPEPSGSLPYSVPADNPFAGAPAPADTIWSYGLRNPYRFSFDSLTGDLAIGDVGQGAREEIDFALSPFPLTAGGGGANYGWNCREGLLAGPGSDPECAALSPSDFAQPVFDYSHGPDPDLGGNRCAVIGGYVARDPALGALDGHYVYTDLCSGVLRALQMPAGAGQASGDCSLGLRLNNPVSFGEDAARRLYVIEEGGRVYRLAGLPPATCPLPSPPSPEPTGARSQPAPTFIRLQALRRRVERGKRALLTVFVSPCSGRRGEPVRLLRNGKPNGSRFLSRACTARFVPQIRHGTTFAAVTFAQRGYAAAESRRLKIRIARHRRH
jgi:hypothetical protein